MALILDILTDKEHELLGVDVATAIGGNFCGSRDLTDDNGKSFSIALRAYDDSVEGDPLAVMVAAEVEPGQTPDPKDLAISMLRSAVHSQLMQVQPC